MNSLPRNYEQFPEDDNGEVLWSFVCQGDNLTVPREIDFSVIFPSEEAAIEFAVTCLRSDFKVELGEQEEPSDDGLNWEVTVYTHAIPAHADISRLEAALGEEAAKSGGRNSGWSAVFVPTT